MSLFFKILITLFILLLAWIAFAITAVRHNESSSRSSTENTQNHLDFKKTNYYKRKPPYTLPFSWTNYKATCENGLSIKIKKSISASMTPYIPLLLPDVVQKIEIYNKSSKLIFTDWVEFNSLPKVGIQSKIIFYNFELFENHGYNLIIPSESGILETDIPQLAKCLTDNDLVNIYSSEQSSVLKVKKTQQENQSQSFYIGKNSDGSEFIQKSANKKKIQYGIISISIFKKPI